LYHNHEKKGKTLRRGSYDKPELKEENGEKERGSYQDFTGNIAVEAVFPSHEGDLGGAKGVNNGNSEGKGKHVKINTFSFKTQKIPFGAK